jgi:hypothetical protein
VGDVRRDRVQHAQQDAKALAHGRVSPGRRRPLKPSSALSIFIAPDTTVLYCMRW